MAEERVIKIVVDKSQASGQLQSVKKEIKETSEVTKGLTSELDKVSGGSISAFKTLRAGLQTAIGGFNSLKVAIIGTGIGALILAIIAVKEAFTSSEEGQNKFAKIMTVIGSITGNLTDLLSKLGMIIIGAFENPKKAITDFANLIKDQIVNRFVGLIELIPQLGKAVGLLFEGKFKESGKVAFDATSKVTTGVENLSDKIGEATEKTKEFIKEMQREAKIAAQIADQRAKADKTDRDLIVQKAEAERNRADLLEKAQQRDKFNQAQRIGFLREASKIDEEITKKEIESAKLRRDAKIEENKLSNSNKDALKEEEELKANVIRLEAQRLQRQKEVTGQIQGLIEQEKAANKAKFEEKKRLQEEELKAEFDNQEKINEIRRKFIQAQEDAEDITEFERLNRKYERDLLELELLGASEQQKIELEAYYARLRNEQLLAIENELLDEEEAIEIEKENKRLEDAEKEIRQAELVKEAKKRIGEQSLNLLIGLAGKQSKIGKGLAIAQIVQEQIKSGAAAFSNLTTANVKAVAASPLTAGQPWVGLNTAQTILGVTSSALGAKQAISQILSGGNSLGSSQSGAAGQGGGVAAPSFNLVQGTGSNQIAETINQNQRPIQAFVVGSNVTSQQELDRRRTANSTI